VTNINGKAYAMNAITPMKTWGTLVTRIFLFLLGVLKGQQGQLKDLSLIHFARWVIVKRNQFPRPDENLPGEDLHHDYMLFFSNFNGTWNQYIDAFSAVLSTGLNHIWLRSEKFPGAVPVTPFKRYINLIQFETTYYYNAYPYATTNDVKAAHRVSSALAELATASASLEPEDFAKVYSQFLIRVQGDLGALGPAPEGT
jgi:hypothetical protein